MKCLASARPPPAPPAMPRYASWLAVTASRTGASGSCSSRRRNCRPGPFPIPATPSGADPPISLSGGRERLRPFPFFVRVPPTCRHGHHTLPAGGCSAFPPAPLPSAHLSPARSFPRPLPATSLLKSFKLTPTPFSGMVASRVRHRPAIIPPPCRRAYARQLHFGPYVHGPLGRRPFRP